MRSSTKTAVGVISLGILGLSYQLGSTATASTGGFAAPVNVPIANAAGAATPDPVASASASPSASATQSAQAKPTATKSTSSSKPSPKPSASTAASSAPAPSASASASQASSSGSGVSKTGNAIESGFGVVQVKVTKVDGKITAVDMLQANASHGRAAAFPYLVQYAIQANGANFGNLSGATYTTNAFKQSLESALAKF